MGAIIRQGPHQGAQKSTITGTGLFKTFSSQSPSVTGPEYKYTRPSLEAINTGETAARNRQADGTVTNPPQIVKGSLRVSGNTMVQQHDICQR